MATAPEAQFQKILDDLYNNATACVRYAYTHLAIDATTAPELRAYLNAHADFWNTVRGGLQASMIVALGRLYDKKNQTLTVDFVLRHAERHPGIFSKPSLRQRKIVSGLNEHDATNFVANRFEPDRSSFEQLRAELNQMRALYSVTVGPVRHNIFAHAGNLTIEQREALFTKVLIRDLERLVVFPWLLWEALWGLFHNGVKPELRETPTNIVEVVEIANPNVSHTLEHLHSTAKAISFLESMRPMYPELYGPGS